MNSHKLLHTCTQLKLFELLNRYEKAFNTVENVKGWTI